MVSPADRENTLRTRLNDRADGLRTNLNDRSNGLRTNLNDRANGIRDNLDARQQRMTQDLVNGLADLPPPPRQPPRLPREEPRGGIPARRGYNEVNLQPGQGGGTAIGVATPWTETERVYGPDPLFLETLDGSGYFRVRPVTQSTFEDANGATIVINWLGAGTV